MHTHNIYICMYASKAENKNKAKKHISIHNILFEE